jgi:N-acetylglucosaminyl-diphospho-decaprenol L-rhamnosyltransferase
MPFGVVAVIVTYNSAVVVGDLLDSLKGPLQEFNSQIVVVDNGSTDDTVAFLEARQDCRVIKAENRGYAAGINRGVREAGPSDAILVLNPDVRVHEDMVSELVSGLRRPGVGIVAPRSQEADGSLDKSLRRQPTLLRATGLSRTHLSVFDEVISRPAEYERAQAVDWAVGAVLLISRACFEAVGGWNESYFLYSEETEFCLRARDLGYLTWYQPLARSTHSGGASGRSTKTYVMQSINRVRLYRRRHGAIASWAYLLLTVLREAARSPGHAGNARRAAVVALLRPSRRPVEMNAADHLLPR